MIDQKESLKKRTRGTSLLPATIARECLSDMVAKDEKECDFWKKSLRKQHKICSIPKTFNKNS